MVPPLRDRLEDLPLLANHCLTQNVAGAGQDAPLLTLAPDVLQALVRHRWPGNVRELENVIDRAVALADGEAIRTEHLALAGLDYEQRELDDASACVPPNETRFFATYDSWDSDGGDGEPQNLYERTF